MIVHVLLIEYRWKRLLLRTTKKKIEKILESRIDPRMSKR